MLRVRVNTLQIAFTIMILAANAASAQHPIAYAPPQATVEHHEGVPSNTQEFEVASIRQHLYGGTTVQSNFPLSGNAYKPTYGRLSVRNFPLVHFIAFAYDLSTTQTKALQAQVEGWVNNDRYDIEAKSEDQNPTKDQMRLMMRSLLAERFKLAVHTETREVPVFGLFLIKHGQTGPKLLPHPDDGSCADAPSMIPAPGAVSAPPAPPKTIGGGFLASCDGLFTIFRTLEDGSTVKSLNGRDVPLSTLASTLSGELEYPVVDKTGLSGTFDVLLSWDPFTTGRPVPMPGRPGSIREPPSSTFAGPTIESSLKQQLGLKLEKQKGNLNFLVLDHIERPSAN